MFPFGNFGPETVKNFLTNHPEWEEDEVTTDLAISILFDSDDVELEKSEVFVKMQRLMSSVKLKDM